MAKNIIKVQEQIDQNLSEFIDKLKTIDASIIKISENARGTGKNIFNVKSPKELNTQLKQRANTTQQLNAFLKEKVSLEKALIRQTNKLKLAEQGVSDALIKQRYEQQELNKRAKQAAILSSSLSSEYKKQSTILIQLRAKYKQVALTLGENSKQAKRLKDEVTALDSRLKRVDANVGQFQRSVGNYSKAMKSATRAARQLAGALGFVGGAFLVVNTIKDAFNTIREFDQQLIAVRKTTNLTAPEMEMFSKEVINLGLSLKGVSIQGLLKASEIAGQLGVRGRDNILKFSEVIEKLKLTSDIVGDEAVRNFAKFIEVSDDTVENADRLGSVITELGNNFATTEGQILKNSTEIQKGLAIYAASAESILGLGAATSALGSEAEMSRGALQKTFKVLNDGAATGKNLDRILKLTGQSAEEFRKEFATDSVKTFQRFIKGLKESSEGGKNLTVTLDELGLSEKRTEATVGVLTKNYDLLTDALDRAGSEYKNNIALNKEAELASQSLNSEISDLSDEWDGFVLSVEDGSGSISTSLKSVIGFFKDVIKGFRLLNMSNNEMANSIASDVANEEYERQKQAIKEIGGLTEKQAIAESDRAFDNIERIKEEINKLEEKNKKINENESSFSKYGKTLANVLTGGVTNGATDLLGLGDVNENQKKIEELSRDLGYYMGVQRAVEETIEFSAETQKKSNEITESSIDKTNKKTKAKKKEREVIEGTIEWYDKMISKIDKESKQYDKTTKAYKASQKVIEGLKSAKEELMGLNDEDLSLLENILDPEEAKQLAKDIQDSIDLAINSGFSNLSDITGEDLTDLFDEFNSLYEWDFQNFQKWSQKKIKQSELEEEKRREVLIQGFKAAGDLGSTLFDRKIQRYDDEIQKNNDYYATLLDNENLSEEQRSALEAERERKNAQLEQKQRQEQQKQARFNKAVALTEIALNTAVAVTKVLGQTGIFGLAASVPIIALGALQAATVLATPIPQYSKGKGDYDNYEGMAIWGEKRREVKISKEGNVEISPRKIGNHLTHVKKDDIIHPDANKFFSEQANNYAAYLTISDQNANLDSYIMQKSYQQILKQQTDKMINAIASKKTKFNLNQKISVSEDIAFMIRKNNTL